MTAHHHTMDVYGAEVWLATNRDQWKALRKALPFLGKRPRAAGMSYFTVRNELATDMPTPHIVVWIDLDRHATAAELVESIAHEAAHAVAGLMGYTGHKKAGDEPCAYLTGWLARWLWDGCNADV